MEGGGGEASERVEEDEVVGCCSGYVLRNHQLMQRERKRTLDWSTSAHQSVQLKCTPFLHEYLCFGPHVICGSWSGALSHKELTA